MADSPFFFCRFAVDGRVDPDAQPVMCSACGSLVATRLCDSEGCDTPICDACAITYDLVTHIDDGGDTYDLCPEHSEPARYCLTREEIVEAVKAAYREGWHDALAADQPMTCASQVIGLQRSKTLREVKRLMGGDDA